MVQFTDASQYLPDTWTWDFGDLTGSSDASPEHTYLADGVYDVTLIVTNAFGSDTLTQFAAITVLTNGPRPDTACLPLSSPTIEGFGILDIELNGVALPSDDAVADGGYLDRSCILDTVEVGSLLDIAVTTGTIATHQIKVWVDWDSSGVFTADEVILDEAHGNFATASSIVPGTAVQNVPLRIRVMADYEVSPALDPCVGPQFGQAEDLALVIITNPDPPIAQFTASPLFSCDGQVQFTDGSLNLATGWTWDFWRSDREYRCLAPTHLPRERCLQRDADRHQRQRGGYAHLHRPDHGRPERPTTGRAMHPTDPKLLLWLWAVGHHVRRYQ
ncbi:MAG: PKD domain-containing protein [Flavobacteriales bacterium]|nr:PKD domain-containing protein [Flavobacteriales bacterium]